MKRTFQLFLDKVTCVEPHGDSTRTDDMNLCGYGITRLGKHLFVEPQVISVNNPNSGSIEFENGRLIMEKKIDVTESDLIICLWYYERDNNSLAPKWEEIKYHYFIGLGDKYDELEIYDYPKVPGNGIAYREIQYYFQAFLEILHEQQKILFSFGDNIYYDQNDRNYPDQASYYGRGNHFDGPGDDVFTGRIIRCHYVQEAGLDQSAPFPNAAAYEYEFQSNFVNNYFRTKYRLHFRYRFLPYTPPISPD